MSKKILKSLSLFLAIILVFSLTACTDKTTTGAAFEYDGNLQIIHADKTIEVPFNDIFKMESVTKTIKSVTSSGEEVTNEVVGVLLNTVLETEDLKQEDFNSIRLVAGDGYAMDVPKDIIDQKEIILAYEFDGEPLSEKKQPLRAAINDVRSMYFVSNLIEVHLDPVSSSAKKEAQKIVVLETEANQAKLHDYTYYESTDKAIKVSDLFTKYDVDVTGGSRFVAGEKFTKTENNDVLADGYFKVTGENRPLFIAPDLPKGMQVKSFITLSTDKVVFLSAEQAIANMSTREINGVKGAKLERVIENAGMNGDFYTLTALDGYSIEVTKASLEHGILCVNDKGQYKITFDDTMPKATSIKDIQTISIGTGNNAFATSATSAENTSGSDVPSAVWSIMFEGLSDGSFEFTSERAERKLELIDVETNIIKNDNEIKDTYQGYRILDVLKFLRVTEFNSLVLTANDGYEIEYSKEEITNDTIFAVAKNGEALKSDELVRFVQDSQFATKWIRGVVKATVK